MTWNQTLLDYSEKFKQTGNTDFIYRNELDKVCFEHDIAYGKSRDLVKRTQSDKVWEIKRIKLLSIQNMMVIKVVIITINGLQVFW